MRFLDDVIILCVHANPDGMELVSNWYMRETDPTQRSMNRLPRLYNKYAGHDDNRDFYMSNLAETQNMNRVMYREWFPQIVYNHHQTGPAGTVMFAPPFRDPFNYNFDPHDRRSGSTWSARRCTHRFVAEGKPGVTMRKGSSYSTWWNGGLRTTAYFHNIIGLLTETIGSPTPMHDSVRRVEAAAASRPAVPDRAAGVALPPVDRLLGHRQLRGARLRVALQGELPLQHLPDGQELDRARQPRHLDDDAAPRRLRPKRPSPVRRAGRGDAEVAAARRRPTRIRARRHARTTSRSCCATPRSAIRAASSCRPTSRTSRRRPSSSTRCVKIGITSHRATAAFTVDGKNYPAGSFVVKTAQAFRPHVLDMFEPQDHPDDMPYPGRPADAALRQRRLDARVPDGRAVRSRPRRLQRAVRASQRSCRSRRPGKVTGDGTAGYLLTPRDRTTRSRPSTACWRRARRSRRMIAGPQARRRSSWRPADDARALVDKLAAELGVSFEGVARAPSRQTR